jgi:hypothetical protein
MHQSVFQKIRGKTFHLLSSLALLISFVAIGASAQSIENLNPSQATAVSVGRGRAIVEGVKLSALDQESKVELYAWLDKKFVEQNLSGEQIRDVMEGIAPMVGLSHPVNVVARHADGQIFYSHTGENLRTDAGDNWQADIMAVSGTPTDNNQCEYIALTNTAVTPAQSDTTLSGEIVANGLSRAAGTYAHTAGSSTFTLAKTFTATGSQSAQASGMFTASSSGTMCFENTFTQVTLATNDTVTVTWTINF